MQIKTYHNKKKVYTKDGSHPLQPYEKVRDTDHMIWRIDGGLHFRPMPLIVCGLTVSQIQHQFWEKAEIWRNVSYGPLNV